MTDQATAVETDPDTDLLAALGEPQELAAPDADNAAVEGEETAEQPEEQQDEAQLFKITVKNDAGEDEEKEVSLDELAKGYMLQADYTRKTQAVSHEKAQAEQEFRNELAKTQQSAVEQLSQLQELVIRQAAPELEGVNWVALSVEDPARFVQLQAKQQALQGTFQALEQHKQQLQAQADQQLGMVVEQALRHSDEYLTKSIKGFNQDGALKLIQDIQKHVGWSPDDLRSAARAMAKEGMAPETLGQVLHLAYEAIQYRQLNAAKPEALKKVAVAPKVLKPAAAQPKRTNQAALDRLKKNGRAEDLAAFL